MWNIAQIATLVGLGGHLLGTRLVIALAWGAVVGSVLQIAIQLPSVLPLVRGMRWGVRADSPGVRQVIRAWIPVVFGAGVVQISSVIDTQLASLLPAGSVAALRYAQLIAILPVSLFGVGVAAVALPELSRDAAAAGQEALRIRLAEGFRQLVFFVIPSAFVFAVLGAQLVGALFQTGTFDSGDTALVAGVLAAYALAVPAQTSIKLLASGHYALGDTKTPVRIAILAVMVSAGCAFALMQSLGPAGIALGAAIGAYLNVALNSLMLKRRLGAIIDRQDGRFLVVVAVASVLSSLAATQVVAVLATQHIWIEAIGGVATFAALYGVVTLLLRHPEARRLLDAVKGRKGT